MIFTFTEAGCSIELDKNAFNESVLYKCFYWYTGKYQVQILDVEANKWRVLLKGKDIWDTNGNLQLETKISQGLIDFKLREIITKETTVIRELLVAKAFSHYDDFQNPATEISDPVGFNPESVTNVRSSKAS